MGSKNKGIAALCTTLTRHPSLTSIDLSDNGFSQAGVADLLLAARENPHLQRVDVTGCACYSAVWIRRLTQQTEENVKFTSEHTLQPQEAAELVTPSPADRRIVSDGKQGMYGEDRAIGSSSCHDGGSSRPRGLLHLFLLRHLLHPVTRRAKIRPFEICGTLQGNTQTSSWAIN